MATKRDLTKLMYNVCELDADDAPIKKTGYTTVGKTHIENGTAVFNGSKNVTVVFGSAFIKVPLIQLTLSTTGTNPAFKNTVTLTGMSIKFQSNFTGEVDWTATERP